MLTAEEARETWRYDQSTGAIVWINPKSNRLKPGDNAGSKSSSSKSKKTYIRIGWGGRLILAHRIAFLIMTGEWPIHQIDHINGDGTDNRWENLRHVTGGQNCKNRKLNSNNSSGNTGVGWYPSRCKWSSKVTANNKTIFLGYFSSKEEAIAARLQANIDLGFHLNHGSVRGN